MSGNNLLNGDCKYEEVEPMLCKVENNCKKKRNDFYAGTQAGKLMGITYYTCHALAREYLILKGKVVNFTVHTVGIQCHVIASYGTVYTIDHMHVHQLYNNVMGVPFLSAM